jgi:hypothetical protein
MFNDINIIRGQMHVHRYYTRTKYWAVSVILIFASYFNHERNELRLFLLIFVLQFTTKKLLLWYQWIQWFLHTYQCSCGESAACYISNVKNWSRDYVKMMSRFYRPPQTPRWQSVLLVKPEDAKIALPWHAVTQASSRSTWSLWHLMWHPKIKIKLKVRVTRHNKGPINLLR